MAGVVASSAVVTKVGQVIDLRNLERTMFGHFLEDGAETFAVSTRVTDIENALRLVSIFV